MKVKILAYNYLFQPEVTLSASSQSPEFPVGNLRAAFRSRVWRSADDDMNASLYIDLGSPESIDSVALFFDSVRAYPLTDGALINIQANAVNTWASPAFTQIISVDADRRAGFHFWDTPQHYRYWRITIDDPGNPAGRVEVGKVVLSRALELSRLPSNDFSYEVDDPSRIQATPYGHEYVDLYPLMRSISLSFEAINYADLLVMEGMYRRLGKAIPFVVSVDPEGEVYDPYQLLFYTKFREPLQARHMLSGRFSISLPLREVF